MSEVKARVCRWQSVATTIWELHSCKLCRCKDHCDIGICKNAQNLRGQLWFCRSNVKRICADNYTFADQMWTGFVLTTILLQMPTWTGFAVTTFQQFAWTKFRSYAALKMWQQPPVVHLTTPRRASRLPNRLALTCFVTRPEYSIVGPWIHDGQWITDRWIVDIRRTTNHRLSI